MTPKEIAKAVRALSDGKEPSFDISGILTRHRCHYLLSLLPEAKKPPQYKANTTLNRIAVKERYKICEALFSEIDFPYAVIKGAVLSMSAYGDPFVRESGDIDILIDRKNADRLKELLLSNGFIQGRVTDVGIVPFSRKEILFQTAMSHQTAPYIKQTKNPLCPYVNVDVNMDIMWGESEDKADMDLVLSLAEQTSLFDIPFYKLTPEMEFIALCLHHYKDMNSLYLLMGGGMRLGHLCDIVYYLSNVHPDAQKLLHLCQALNVGRYVYTCIYHTNIIFESNTLAPYIYALKSEKDTSLLDSFGLTEKERKPWGLSLEERLFHSDIREYVDGLLSDEEKEKVKANQKYM